MAFAGNDAALIDLPMDAELKFNGPFLVTSLLERSGTALTSHIEIARVDLKGKSHEAQISRQKFGALIKKLSDLKNFDKLEKVYCFIDFNEKYQDDTLIQTGDTFKFRTPEQYGSPTSHTTLGNRIMLDTTHDSTISASFDAPDVSEGKGYAKPLLRRLYCSFTAAPEFGWGTDFVSDMKISHLETLLAPYFELRY